MSEPVEILAQRVDALRGLDAEVPGGVSGLTCARDEQLLQMVETAQSAILSAQGVLAAAAGEISRRSVRSSESSLAKQHGEPSAKALIAHRAGLSFGEAARLVEVGEAIRPRQALSGEDLPAERPHIAAALLVGELPIALAHLIAETVGKVAHLLLRDGADELERVLVRMATSGAFSVRELVVHCKQIPDRLDPDGAEPRDKHLRDRASYSETTLANGLLRVVAELDPERAAYLKAAMNARLNPRRADPAVGDRTQPTREQARLDAFASILRDAVKADDGDQSGVDTTVLVRIDMADLLSGIGSATIDGIDTPISAATARRMAAEADVIPQVFSGNSVLLDQGQSKRAFTRQQRYAILAMFIGCAFPKCDIPSAMTQMHHIGRWAGRHEHARGTDLLNGIPLCPFHNRLMEEGWEIEFDPDRVPWFVPPATLDPRQTPLRGGNLATHRAA